MIQQVGVAVCCLAIGLFGACAGDDFVNDAGQEVPQEPGFYLSVGTEEGMIPASTRSAGVDALNENLIRRVDIFVFKADGTLNPGGYVTASSEQGITGNVPVYTGSAWKENFKDDGSIYSIYALANYKGETSTLEGVQKLDDLKALVDADEDIVKWQGMKGYSEAKTFLMDGKATFDKNDFPTDNAPYVVPVQMYRAAVKVELTLNFSEDWKEKYLATDLKVQVTNFASSTAALAEGNPLDAAQRGYMTYPAPESGNEKEAFTNAFVFNKGTDADHAFNGSQVRFYAYVNRWDDLATNETMLLIDLPGTLTENNTQTTLEHNFYKIPILSNAKEQVLERNTYYKITATVNMKGSEVVDVPVELMDVNFTTAQWQEETVNVGEGDVPSYLILSKSVVDIRNVDSYDGLEFYSSSPIKSVEIVGFNSQAEATAAGVDFIYPGNGTTIPGIFFVNKNNQRTEVDKDDPNGDGTRWDNGDDEVKVTFDAKINKGDIHLISTNPENVTKRYITLKVTNEDGLSKYVVVEQYPLEYIQPIAGYYSYRDDFMPPSEASPNNVSCTWEQIFTSSNRLNTSNFVTSTNSNGEFRSKVYTTGQSGWSTVTACFYYVFERSGGNGNYTYKATTNGSSGLTNNMMYFVTITQTDESYKVAHPLTVYDTDLKQMVAVSSAENDQLVSPAFMLASQLGAVTGNTFNWTSARNHCANYVETYKLTDANGKETVYKLDDWRLPTSKELEVIVRYQSEATEVMDQVVAGDYYFISYQYGGSNSNGKGPGAGTANGTGVRCIRDVKPTDDFLQK